MKNERPESGKTKLSSHACCDLRGFGGSRNWMENGGQKASKMTSKSSFGTTGADLYGFWRFLGEADFG